MKKKLLFVINTLSRAGAEMAFLALLEKMESMPEYADCEISVFVLMGQGELVTQLPPSVRLCNRTYRTASVLSRQGVRAMKKTLLRAMFHRGTVLRLFPYLAENFCAMAHAHRILPDKLLWRVLSDGSSVQKEQYDLAVAFLEGGSAYYTADHVNAKKKAAFIHIDYLQAGYTRKLDRDCYLKFDAIFPIGENVRKTFLSVYPECAGKTSIFHNIINQKEILRKAELPGGFTDDFPGIRILTVGRLTKQKAYPVAVEAMRLLKQEAVCARWYVLGDGEERENLKNRLQQRI